MLEIHGRTIRLCDGTTRRSFLTVGSLGLGGLALDDVLRARTVRAASDRRDTAVILFWRAGGQSHIDTYDMKPVALADRQNRPVRLVETGQSIAELF